MQELMQFRPVGIDRPPEALLCGLTIPLGKVLRMDKRPYEAPTVRVVGSLQELTLVIQKHNNNTPDGYAYNGTILTS